MSEQLSNSSEDPALNLVDFQMVARGSLDPTQAAALQQRVVKIFAGIDGLQFSVTMGQANSELLKPLLEQPEDVETIARRDWLHANILEVLRESGASVRTINCLKRERIDTRLKALLYGSYFLSDIRNLGEKSLKEVRAVLDDNPYGIELKEHPTLADAAEICDDIYDLPGYYVDRIHYFHADKSVGQILDMSIDDIIEIFVRPRATEVYDSATKSYTTVPHTREELEQYQRDAERFLQKMRAGAREFAALKSRV